jgi:hypothetical protein
MLDGRHQSRVEEDGLPQRHSAYVAAPETAHGPWSGSNPDRFRIDRINE